MKLPFTWAELSPADKAWLAEVPASAVWDFVETLPADERAPFDADLYAPSGADFMREYGDRLREFIAAHPTGVEDQELLAAFNSGADLEEILMRRESEKAKAPQTDPLIITAKRKLEEGRAGARSSQGGIDRKLTETRKDMAAENARLKAEVARLKAEVEQGRAVLDTLLDQTAKGGKA